MKLKIQKISKDNIIEELNLCIQEQALNMPYNEAIKYLDKKYGHLAVCEFQIFIQELAFHVYFKEFLNK